MRKAGVLAGSIFFFVSLAALAQENRQEISVQGTGFFSSGTSGNGTSYSTTKRVVFSRLIVIT